MENAVYTADIDVRLRDVDFMGHVNNAVYATYIEQAREAFFEEALDVSLVEVGTVLVNLEIDYRRPIEATDEVEITLDVTDLGTSSIPMEYEVRADGELAATARTVQVLVDEDGDAKPLPAEWRNRIGGE
ncbi:acyl-CoA thioesterase [Natrarchaeobaculum sulfurireducens]|uniref:Acyl-CoA thioesterase FadM n=1 Tax=Natrarchaeobaculum sulfurireducens TaxID=2044521 RepID=A0A346PFK6_9EURY|nr:thioesterase family protein [Natrarchaeobaculum sulfurireducens]AXR78301.1 Acyl-CoA thioesterase FadM [Natrarchaeobaculum sulfurireducens]